MEDGSLFFLKLLVVIAPGRNVKLKAFFNEQTTFHNKTCECGYRTT